MLDKNIREAQPLGFQLKASSHGQKVATFDAFYEPVLKWNIEASPLKPLEMLRLWLVV